MMGIIKPHGPAQVQPLHGRGIGAPVRRYLVSGLTAGAVKG